MRRADDAGAGPPAPVALTRRAAKTGAATAEGTPQWDAAAEEAVAAGTGCFHDRGAVRRALVDSRGDPDQARSTIHCCPIHTGNMKGGRA